MSITNFEELTEDLSEAELSFKSDVDFYLCALLSGKKSEPVKQTDIIDYINYQIQRDHGKDGIKINTARLRKYFNYFRTNGVLAIIATKDGCYISDDKIEIEKQILSLKERARQIMKAADGMSKFLI